MVKVAGIFIYHGDDILLFKRSNKFDDGKGIKRYALFAKELNSKVEPVIDDEHSDWGWFNKDNLPSPLAPFIIHGIGEIYAR